MKTVIRGVCGAILVLVTVSCQRPNPMAAPTAFHQTIPKAPTVSHEDPFPGPPLLPAEAVKLIRDAEHLRDILPIQKFVRLELTDASVLGQIRKVLWIKQHWIVWDAAQNQVFCFKEDGQFAGSIGRGGQGPGEYVQVGNIAPVWGDHIGVEDGMRGVIMVFDIEGRLVRETTRFGGPGDGGKIIIFHQFIWETPERFYLADFTTGDPRVPRHLAMDYSGEGKVLFGFGERPVFYENLVAQGKTSRHLFSNFVHVGGKIWAAEPLAANINVYEEDGSFRGSIHGANLNAMTFDHYADFPGDRQKNIRFFMEHLRNLSLVPYGDLVIQRLSGGKYHEFNFYDRNGNLLRSALKPGTLSLGIQTEADAYLVSVYHSSFLSSYEEQTSPEEMALLLEAGWRPEKNEEENEFLCLRKMAW